jgi:hypothetical protein
MNNITRRQLLTTALVTLAAGPLLTFSSPPASAVDMPRVNPDDAQPKALSYVHASPEADRNCANCQLYTGSADSEWGPCAIFPGKQVAGAGWCSAWAKRSS